MKKPLSRLPGLWGAAFGIAAAVVSVTFILVFFVFLPREALTQALLAVGGCLAVLWIFRGLLWLLAMVQLHRMNTNDKTPEMPAQPVSSVPPKAPDILRLPILHPIH